MLLSDEVEDWTTNPIEHFSNARSRQKEFLLVNFDVVCKVVFGARYLDNHFVFFAIKMLLSRVLERLNGGVGLLLCP